MNFGLFSIKRIINYKLNALLNMFVNLIDFGYTEYIIGKRYV